MRAGGKILMIFGLVLGMIAAGANFIILLNNDAGSTDGGGGTGEIGEVREVIVAVQPIEPWTEIPPDAVVARSFPAPLPADVILAEMPADQLEQLQQEATEGAEGAEQQEQPEQPEGEEGAEGEMVSGQEYVAGKISNSRIYPGQVIVQSQLVDKTLEEQRLGLGSNASYIIPNGQVALAIPIDSKSSIAGALKAGDFIDIIASFEEEEERPGVTQIYLQRVQVLRVGLWAAQESDDEAAGAAIVTVLLEPQQAVEFHHLQAATEWTFALRSITDEGEFVTEPVTDDYLMEQYNALP